MTGRAEVERQKRRLDAVFERISSVDDDPELLSDLARYLCVLISGFLEQAVIELILEYASVRSSESVQRHVAGRIRRFTTPNAKNLAELLGSFDLDLQNKLETYLIDEYKDAVDSIVNLRHAIAHGRSAERHHSSRREIL